MKKASKAIPISFHKSHALTSLRFKLLVTLYVRREETRCKESPFYQDADVKTFPL